MKRDAISNVIQRLNTTQVRTHFAKIVQEVAETERPVIVQNRGEDQAVIISLQDFDRLHSPVESRPMVERDRVRASLQSSRLLSEPSPEMRRRATDYSARYTPDEQEKRLTELRSLHLDPPLSQIILESRTSRSGLEWVTQE